MFRLVSKSYDEMVPGDLVISVQGNIAPGLIVYVNYKQTRWFNSATVHYVSDGVLRLAALGKGDKWYVLDV